MDNYFNTCPPRMNDGRFLEDFRQANTREQFIKMQYGITDEDDYRAFLQKNADSIMNNDWNILRNTQSCKTNCCIHNYPTRATPGMNYEELKIYNAVRNNTLQSNNPLYPACKQYPDYRAMHTSQVRY